MVKYICEECGKDQYSADTKSKSPCIYCGGKVKKEEKCVPIEYQHPKKY
jgi:DNA-directed RNA polymerase subunit RPC12/RpoP